ncbi:MAG: M20/M25/M40 family metallo-hydrolase, partial [Firmicutes bacterium]|nr:M20/M25/M40 family metallo-hydrolase [Bacillota bacterium]
PEKHRGLLTRKLLGSSPKTAAMLRTTISFTMAQGSKGTNIIPAEAWVIGNMRYSHHQGRDASIEAAKKLAAKYDIETEVLDPGQETAVTDYRGEAYRLVAEAVKTVFPGTVPTPYIMTGASDSRFFRRVCDQCICFLPFKIDDAQLNSIHAADENINLGSLAPAVDFYRCLMKGSQ